MSKRLAKFHRGASDRALSCGCNWGRDSLGRVQRNDWERQGEPSRPRANRLSAAFVARVSKPGRYGDGGGLYLQIAAKRKGAGERHVSPPSWVFRYQRDHRAREMGLGPVSLVGLAEARERARECRRQLLAGADPIDARQAARQAARAATVVQVTFRECAERYIAAHETGWRNPKHRAQWPATLKAHAYPTIGELDVKAVDVGLVLKCVEPIWFALPETAGRVRGRIEAVLDWATARGYRQGDNPARWKGHLDNLLARRRKAVGVRHHAALPFAEIPEFMTALRTREGVAARALEFVILTAARSGEARGARWSEIDRTAALWTVPAGRMKSGREHRVPLPDRALEILADLPTEDDDRDGYVFIGGRAGTPLSDMSLLAVLRRMKRADVTVHGFRSTLRDWAGDQTNFARDVVEAALAHAIADKTEAAYRRGDALAKRRRLMTAWAGYCAASPADRGRVLPMAR